GRQLGYDQPEVPTDTRFTVGDPLATVETVTYPLEQYTEEEQARLAPHFTNLDRPVFALVNLPETVKGALFARYSRYAGTLRRLFLDEFAESLPEVPVVEFAEGERAAKLYETIFLGYGDDSVAQLGGAHVRGDAPRGAAARDAELRRSRAAPRPRRPLDRVPPRARRGVGVNRGAARARRHRGG